MNSVKPRHLREKTTRELGRGVVMVSEAAGQDDLKVPVRVECRRVAKPCWRMQLHSPEDEWKRMCSVVRLMLRGDCVDVQRVSRDSPGGDCASVRGSLTFEAERTTWRREFKAVADRMKRCDEDRRTLRLG